MAGNTSRGRGFGLVLASQLLDRTATGGMQVSYKKEHKFAGNIVSYVELQIWLERAGLSA